MALRVHMLAFVSLVLGRRIRTDMDQMQDTMQGEDSTPPFPQVAKFAGHVAQHAHEYAKPLQEVSAAIAIASSRKVPVSATKAQLTWGIASDKGKAEFANEADDMERANEAIEAFEAEIAKAEFANEAFKAEWAYRFADEPAEVKNTVKDGFQTTKNEWAKAADKVTAEIADNLKEKWHKAHDGVASTIAGVKHAIADAQDRGERWQK